jgi:hypothetical protein
MSPTHTHEPRHRDARDDRAQDQDATETLVEGTVYILCSCSFFFLNERPHDYVPFLLVKKEFTSKRSQRSEYRSVKEKSYTQYL